MDFFEYQVVMISIILGLGVTAVIQAAGRLVGRGRAVRWDPIFAMWLVLLGLLMINYWWANWDLKDLGLDLRQWQFYFVLTGPVVLVLAAHALLPSDPNAVDDLRAHYESRSRRFFVTLAPLQAWNLSVVPVLLGRWSPTIVVQLVLVGLVAAGILFRNRIVHYAIVITWLGTVVWVVFVIRATAG